MLLVLRMWQHGAVMLVLLLVQLLVLPQVRIQIVSVTIFLIAINSPGTCCCRC